MGQNEGTPPRVLGLSPRTSFVFVDLKVQQKPVEQLLCLNGWMFQIPDDYHDFLNADDTIPMVTFCIGLLLNAMVRIISDLKNRWV